MTVTQSRLGKKHRLVEFDFFENFYLTFSYFLKAKQ